MKNTKPKLLIIGHKQHGKDAVAEMFRDNWGYEFKSSSIASLEIFLFDKLNKEHGFKYKTIEEAYEDRHDNRALWFEEITAYNTPDKSRLAGEILKDSDMYVGMRNWDEIESCKEKGLFDYVIWVYRPGFEEESADSFNITIADADCVIVNNGTLDDLKRKVDSFMGACYAWQDFERDIVLAKDFNYASFKEVDSGD